jgi:hypothetical protein
MHQTYTIAEILKTGTELALENWNWTDSSEEMANTYYTRYYYNTGLGIHAYMYQC